MDEAERLTGGSSALTYLRKLYTELAQAGYGAYIRFDMGLVHQIDYYTGVVFRGYVEGAGDAVLSGGRYDRLVEAFGRRAPGHRLCRGCGRSRGLPPQPGAPRVKFLVHFGGGELSRALKAVDEHAVGTCELSPCENLDETERLAREKGAGAVLVLEEGTERVVQL